MRRGPMGGGPMGMMAMPGEKSMDFWPSAKRLLGRLRPERALVVLVILLGVVSVTFSVLGPKILGEGTNLIFEGFISSQMPAGATQEQVVAALRAQGNDQQADMVASMNLVPGQGIDFTALATVLAWVLVLYVLAALFAWAQGYVLNGVTQRTVYRLRQDVEAKIHRLPL
jgi:ATP-binding cassette subfamily B protein